MNSRESKYEFWQLQTPLYIFNKILNILLSILIYVILTNIKIADLPTDFNPKVKTKNSSDVKTSHE